MSLRERSEENACVTILEWRLPSLKYTDGGLRVKGTFSHGAKTNTSLFGDDPE